MGLLSANPPREAAPRATSAHPGTSQVLPPRIPGSTRPAAIMLRRAVWSLASSLALVYSAHSSRRDAFKNRSGRGGSYTRTTRRLCCQSLGIRLEAFQWPTVAAVPVTSPSSILGHYCCATGPSPSDCNNRPAPALGLHDYPPGYTRQFPPSPRSLPKVTFDLCRQVFPVHQLKKLDAAISLYPFPALFSFIALRAT